MNTKLDNITTQYRTFNDNQVLTDGQLNEFIDYFEDQDRLTRTRLNGVGIACGFESTIETNGSLTITQGVGVTTDGDLLMLRGKGPTSKQAKINITGKNYTYYRTFNDDLSYPHFNNGTSHLPLLELLTTEDYQSLGNVVNNADSPKPLSGFTTLANMTVILYLESYSSGDTPCEDIDCTNKGDEQIANLRVLLAESTKVQSFLVDGPTPDNIYKIQNNFEKLYDELPELQVKRVILDTSIISGPQLKAKFQDAITANDIVSRLSDSFDRIATTFNTPYNLNGVSLYNKLFGILNTAPPTVVDYQYRYDLLKDLLDTYNEIKGLLLHLKSSCCPEITSFPKHLLLGNAGKRPELGTLMANRHDFYSAASNTNDDENYQRIKLLNERFIQKITNFQSISGPIKVTPSRIAVKLGERAVPAYYNVNTSLLQKWNFEKAKTDREVYNLSYSTAALAGVDYIQNPLKYNLDDNDFFRVEGAIGIPFTVAAQSINSIIKQYNLPFRVVTVVLDNGKSKVTSTPTGGIRKEVSSELLELAVEPTVISVKELRDQLLAISGGISNQSKNIQDTLQDISKLDVQLKKLNNLEAADTLDTRISLVKENPIKSDIVSELLSDLLTSTPGMEHLGGAYAGGTLFLLAESEQNNKVLADFTLPYMCCAKKDTAFLVLPSDKICANAATMPMTIVPLDGEIKAFAGTVPLNVIRQKGGQNFFTPALVNKLYYGQTITFTVNDTPVDAKITVYPQPAITLQVNNITYDYNTKLATVYYKVTNTGTEPIASYQWNYGNETTNTQAPGPDNLLARVFPIELDENVTYTTTLTVVSQNGGCSTQVNVSFELKGIKAIPCGEVLNFSGEQSVYEYNIDFKEGIGSVGLSYNVRSTTCRFVIEWDGKKVADSGYVGKPTNLQSLINAGVKQDEINLSERLVAPTSLKFTKDKATPAYAKVTVYSLGKTAWDATGLCAIER